MDGEAQLVDRARAGDADALEQLLDGHALSLSGEIEAKIGAQYRGVVEADDILQVTFLEAFMQIRAFVPGGPGSFLAWLRRVALNNLRDAIKELERDKRPPPGRRVAEPGGEASYVALVERLAATSTTPSRVSGGNELRQHVDDLLRQLPSDYERALRLYDLDGLSAVEVGEALGRSHGAARMLIARARERLAELVVNDPRFASKA